MSRRLRLLLLLAFPAAAQAQSRPSPPTRAPIDLVGPDGLSVPWWLVVAVLVPALFILVGGIGFSLRQHRSEPPSDA